MAVRRLMNQRKFDHVIALIGAALRHRQCQPWMYEALALALDAAGRPKAEIERAIMSAVDFVDNTTDLMYIGAYLSQMDLNERALQVYRQAASLDPLRPEPYMLGLRAARATNNLEGLKWASLGILGQAWPKEQANVWQAGLGVAKEVLDKLRAEKRTKEADHFLAALNEAVARDCVAIVTWTGDGDVDVLVEEPSGTVCSLRNPRTTAGGILLERRHPSDGTRQFRRPQRGLRLPQGIRRPVPDVGPPRVGQRHGGKGERGSHYPRPDAAAPSTFARGFRWRRMRRWWCSPEGRPPQGSACRAAGGQRRGRNLP